MFNTLHAALLALSCMCLGESAAFGPLEVRRSSLDGFDVAGLGAGLDVEEAAHAVARAAALLASVVFAPVARAGQPLIVRALERARSNDPYPRVGGDLVRAPHRVLNGRMSETWKEGDAANERLRVLRSSAIGPYVSQQTEPRGRGFLKARKLVEITYPANVSAPAIERTA